MVNFSQNTQSIDERQYVENDLDFVGFDELCIGIDVVDVLIPQGHPVTPVQRANVVIHRSLHGLPIMLHCEEEEGNDSKWLQVYH